MSRKIPALERLVLKGLEMAPSQVWGSVRLVPLLRHTILGDLRLSRRSYDEDATWVDLADKTVYCSYIPHGLIASWTPDGLPIAAFGCQMTEHGSQHHDGKRYQVGPVTVRIMHRMAKREGTRRLRFLPLHTF